jgi:hypothetical protein
MKKDEAKGKADFFPMDGIIRLPIYDDDGSPEFNLNFFDGINIFSADVVVLHHILSSYIDYEITFPEIYTSFDWACIEKAYFKAEAILKELSKSDIPEGLRGIFDNDLKKLESTRMLFSRESLMGETKHKSITQQLTCQAYLLFEYLKEVCLRNLYDPDDFKMDRRGAEIHKSIVEIFKRVYSEKVLPWPITVEKIQDLLRNAKSIEINKLRELNKVLVVYKNFNPFQ